MTAYRWVSAWGYDLLPVAALFGMVKSSGVASGPEGSGPAGGDRREVRAGA